MHGHPPEAEKPAAKRSGDRDWQAARALTPYVPADRTGAPTVVLAPATDGPESARGIQTNVFVLVSPGAGAQAGESPASCKRCEEARLTRRPRGAGRTRDFMPTPPRATAYRTSSFAGERGDFPTTAAYATLMAQAAVERTLIARVLIPAVTVGLATSIFVIAVNVVLIGALAERILSRMI